MSQPKKDLPQFTGLRGLAALLVLFFHIRRPDGTELTFGWADPFSIFGYLGVDIFFVLSGFILSHVYSEQFAEGVKGRNLREFAVARFARIYPLHFVTTIMMLFAYAMAVRSGTTPHESSGYSLTSTILGLLLLQECFGVVAPNAGSWSISIELLNYVTFPFLIAVSAKMPRYWPYFAIALGTAAAAIPANTNVLHGVAEFVMGCAAYALTSRVKPQGQWPLVSLFFALPFLVFYFCGTRGFWMPALSFTAMVYFLAAASGKDPFARLCATRPLVFIGDISYSVYLLQWFVWIGWKHVIARLPFFSDRPYVMVACASASLIVLSTTSYYWFERPTRIWVRRQMLFRRKGLRLPRRAKN
jgi:peptidoglycan/LPS O-acetylase OafA/YrhL